MKIKHLYLIFGFILINMPSAYKLGFYSSVIILSIGGSILIYYGQIKNTKK